MTFCRGCGQSIHETATSCPHCGATQGLQLTQALEPDGTLWLSVPALVLGITSVLGLIGVGADADQTGAIDKDAVIGLLMLAVPGLVLGMVGATRQARGRGMSISAIVLTCVCLLAAIGLLTGL